jgi:hypothetical protein
MTYSKNTTVELNGVDVTGAFEAIEMHSKEKDKALESLTYLLEEHFEKASQTSIAGKFALGFSLVFDRLAGRTSIKAKVSYSRRFTDEVEAFAQLHEQGGLFDHGDD